MSISSLSRMTVDDLVSMRDKMLQSNTCSFKHQRMLVYLGMVLADKLVVQGDLMMGEEELQTCSVLLQREEGWSEEEEKMLLHDRRKVRFLQMEIAVLSSQFAWGQELRLQLSPLVDPEVVSHYSYLCYSAGAELSRIGRQEEASDWLISVLQVDREYEVPRIRDASIKLLIQIAKSEKEMLDYQEKVAMMKMVELLPSPHDQLLVRLDLATSGILDQPKLPSTMAMSFSNIMSVMAMSHINSRQEEVLMWLLDCPWNDLSSSQKEDCLSKMIYTGRKLVTSLAY